MNTNLKNVLQKLVNKLEIIEKDGYFQGNYVVSLWKKEFQEAKKALEENNKSTLAPDLCTGFTTSRDVPIKDVDLFDVRQLELPLKHEDEL